MKKPKITKGEWNFEFIDEKRPYLGYQIISNHSENTRSIICNSVRGKDAPPLSAVPEMMQDLYDWYVNMKDFDEDDVFINFGGFERTTFDELMESTRKTLVKAGCDL